MVIRDALVLVVLAVLGFSEGSQILISSSSSVMPTIIIDHICDMKNPCKHGGTCEKINLFGYRCHCVRPYYGKNCEMQSISTPQPPPTSSMQPTPTSTPIIHTDHVCDINSPCGYHGTCIKDDSHMDGYTCSCYPPYQGSDCQMYSSSSSQARTQFTILPTPTPTIIYDHICDMMNPCKHGGACKKINIFGYRCLCQRPYYGKHCEMQIHTDHVCDINSPCGYHGTCIKDDSHMDGYTCSCYPPYQGSDCQMYSSSSSQARTQFTILPTPTPTIDLPHPCDFRNPCKNGGRCIKGRWSLKCDCPPPYHGKRCQYYSNRQSSSSSYTTSTSSPTVIIDYFYVCHPLYYNCENGGTCIKERGYYKCVCPPSYFGERCGQFYSSSSSQARTEFTILPTPRPTITFPHPCDFPHSNPCKNGGTCIRNKRDFIFVQCACPSPYHGMHCQKSSSSLPRSSLPQSSPSSPSILPTPTPTIIYDHICDLRQPCQNGGSCIKDGWSFKCDCSPPYHGNSCQLYSSSSPLPIETTWVMTTVVPTIFHPHICDLHYENPCRNGGSCVHDDVLQYRCICPLPYHGRHCNQYSSSLQAPSSSIIMIRQSSKLVAMSHRVRRSMKTNAVSCKRLTKTAQRLFADPWINWKELHPAIRDVTIDLIKHGDHKGMSPRAHAQIKQALTTNSLKDMRTVMGERRNWKRVPVHYFKMRKQHLDEALKTPFGFAMKRRSKMMTCE